jgi:small subunit ribosomal protein S9
VTESEQPEGSLEVAAEDVDTDAGVVTDVVVDEGGVEVEVRPEVAPVVVASTTRVLGDRPIITVGRRKQAIVRVRLVPGTGVFTLNGRTLDSYFPNKVHQQHIKEPLTVLDKAESFDVIARLHGGGVTGQAGALQLGIARALIEINPDDRPQLKRAGFLTRDARVKERKKYGLKKARKAPQYSKR